MSWKTAFSVGITAFALSSAGALASDAEFNKALKEAKCVPAQVSTLREGKELKVYEVTCLGNPPRTVGMSCTRSTCSLSTEGEETDREVKR